MSYPQVYPVLFKQGEDYSLKVPILDSASPGLPAGTPATLTGVTKIFATLFVANQEMPVRYSLEALVGYGELSLGTGAEAHVATLEIVSAQSKDFPTGLLAVAVSVFYPDLGFADGDRKKEYYYVAGMVDTGRAKAIV